MVAPWLGHINIYVLKQGLYFRAHNKIIEIGFEFMANLPNLKVLDLSNNYITKIPSEIFLKASSLNIL